MQTTKHEAFDQFLRTLDYGDDTTFKFLIHDLKPFVVEKILRIIPKKRLVVRGHWQNQTCIAKIFFDPHHAKEHLEKDASGIKTLIKNDILTPKLIYSGNCESSNIYVSILQNVSHASNLHDLFLAGSIDRINPIFPSLMIELATQHVLGISQQDLHLKNFLITSEDDADRTYKIYTLDGGQIQKQDEKLNKSESMENIALFLSQLGIENERSQKNLFSVYAKARGWSIRREDEIQLFSLIKKWYQLRCKQYQKKIVRASSDFMITKNWRTFSVYQREFRGPLFGNFLENPDQIFNFPSTVYLKKGRSSTVIKACLDGKWVVIKRYNLKHFRHFVRRMFRRTRAYHAWMLAQKLTLLGVKTAKPIAMIEKKWGCFRHISYYVSEYVEGQNALTYFKNEGEQDTIMIEKIASIMKNLLKLNITHGDLKLTNILIDAKKSPILIDLDGAIEHASFRSLHSAFHQDKKRLLQNFAENTAIYQAFYRAFNYS